MHVLVSADHEHAQMVPVEEEFLDTRRTVSHRIVGADAPPFVGRILGGNLGHPHETERLREVGTQSGRYHPLGVDGPLVLQEILRFFQGAGFQIVVGIAGETVGGQFVRRMFHTEDQAVPVEVVARDGQARLPDATLVVLVARVDALVPLEAVVKVGMKATRNAEPVLHVVGQLGSRRPVTRLAESHVLYQVIRVHEEGAPVNQDREVIGRVVIQFLGNRDMLLALDAHRRT